MSALVVVVYMLHALPAPSADADSTSCGADSPASALTATGDAGTALLQLGAGTKAVPDGGACGWRVWYDRWLPSFVPGEYEGPGSQGGAHCLAACCADPSCKGLALMSSELYQCYKYSELPAELGSQVGRPLGNAQWLTGMKSAWSVFVKADVAAKAHLDASSVQAWTTQNCEWSVHYDLWLDTFERGQYEPPNALGGAHCLVACCQDPTCKGLALESIEKYQCYKYKGLPDALATRQGVPLGDAKWLLQKPSAWSIFVKVPPVQAIASGAAASAIPGPQIASQKQHASRLAALMPKPAAWGTRFAHVGVLVAGVALVGMLAAHFAASDTGRLHALSKKLGLGGAAPEARGLLDGIDLKPMAARSEERQH